MTQSYPDKLLDPRWQKKRLLVMQRDEFACVRCGDAKSTLTVHHGYYEAGAEPWEYPDAALWTLCWNCHRYVERQIFLVRELIGLLHPRDVQFARVQLARVITDVDMAKLEHEFVFDGERDDYTFPEIVGSRIETRWNVLAKDWYRRDRTVDESKYQG